MLSLRALVPCLAALAVTVAAVGGVLSADTEYTSADSPVRITATLGVAEGVTLILKPGVQVVCLAVSCVQLLGRLEVQGSASDPVIFSCEGAGCAAEGAWVTILSGDQSGKGAFFEHAFFDGASSPPCSVTAVLAEHSDGHEYQTSMFTNVTARCVKFRTGGRNNAGVSGVHGLKFTQGDFQYVEWSADYPRPAKIEIMGASIRDSTIRADSYAIEGLHLLDSRVSGSYFRIGCCSSLLRISGSEICDSAFQDYNNYWDIDIRGSTLTNSPVRLTQGGSLTIADTTVTWGVDGIALDLEGNTITLNLDGVSLLGGGGGTALRLAGGGTKQISGTLLHHFSTAVQCPADSFGQLTVTSSNFIGIDSLLFENVGTTDVSVSSCFFDSDNELDDLTVDQQDALSYGKVTYTQVRQSASDAPPQAPPPPGSVFLDVGNKVVKWGLAQGAESYQVSLWAPPPDDGAAPCTAFGETLLTELANQSQQSQVYLALPEAGASGWVCAVQALGAGGRTSWYTFAGSGASQQPSHNHSFDSPSPAGTPSPGVSTPSPTPPSPAGTPSPGVSTPSPTPSSTGSHSNDDHNQAPNANEASDSPAGTASSSAVSESSGGWLLPAATAVAGVLLALVAVLGCWLLRHRRVQARSRPLEAEVAPAPVAVMEAPVEEELRPPTNWSQHNNIRWTSTGSAALVEVDGLETLGLQELIDKTFRKVRTRDRKTGPMPERLKIISVQRVENTELWQKYAASRRALKNKRAHKCTPVESRGGVVRTMESRALGKIMMGILNEVYLWHGTSEAGATAIVQGGFKVELAGSSAGTLYGKGVYMAECSSKADEYTGSDEAMPGARCLLLCRAVLGEVLSLTAGGEATYPMIEAGIKSGAYDSVLGDREASVGTYREFVVYDSSRVYPEYLIRYEHELE